MNTQKTDYYEVVATFTSRQDQKHMIYHVRAKSSKEASDSIIRYLSKLPANKIAINSIKILGVKKVEEPYNMDSIPEGNENIGPSVTTTVRPLSSIARDVRKNWPNVNFAAKPYLDAMATMNSIDDNYGMDSGKSVVAYFLSNATTWRGPEAKRIKLELNAMLKGKKSMNEQKQRLKKIISVMLKEILHTDEVEIGDRVVIGGQTYYVTDLSDVVNGKQRFFVSGNDGDDLNGQDISLDQVDHHEKGDEQSQKALQTLAEGRKRKSKKKKIEEEDQQVAPPTPVDVPEVKPETPAPVPTDAASAPDASGAPKADKQKAYKYLLGAMKAMIKNGTITGISEEEMVSYAQSLYKALNKSIQGASLEKLGAGEEAPSEEPAPEAPPSEEPAAPEAPAEKPAPEVSPTESPAASPEAPTPEAPAAPAPEAPAPEAPAPEQAPKEQPADSVPEKPKAKPAPKATSREPTNMAPAEPESDENTDQLKEAIRNIVETEIEEYRTKGALGMKNRPLPSTTSSEKDMIFALRKLSSYAPADRLDDMRRLLDIDPVPYTAMTDESDALFKSIQDKLTQLEKSTDPMDKQLLTKAFDVMSQSGWLKESSIKESSLDGGDRRMWQAVQTMRNMSKQQVKAWLLPQGYSREQLKWILSRIPSCSKIPQNSITSLDSINEEGGEYKPRPPTTSGSNRPKTNFVVVLNDDETFSGAEGCMIAELNDESADEMQMDAHLSDVETIRKWKIVIANGTPQLKLVS